MITRKLDRMRLTSPVSRRGVLGLGAGALLGSLQACNAKTPWLTDLFRGTPPPLRVVLIDTSKSRSVEDAELYNDAAQTLLKPMFEITQNVDLERNVEHVADGERVLVGPLGEAGIGSFRASDFRFQKRKVYFEDLKNIKKTATELVGAIEKLIHDPPLQRRTCIIETLLALGQVFESAQARQSSVDVLICSDALESSGIIDFEKISWADPVAQTEQILARLRQRRLIARMKGVRTYIVGQGGTLAQVTGTTLFWQKYVEESGGRLEDIGRNVPSFPG
jgi:hypothetical protein